MGNSGRTWEEMIDTGASVLDCNNISINAIGVVEFAAGQSVAVSIPDGPDEEGLMVDVLHIFIKTQEGESYEFTLMDKHIEVLHTALTRMSVDRMKKQLLDDEMPAEVRSLVTMLTEAATETLADEEIIFKEFNHDVD